jgi:hypothetical protein
MNNYWMLPAAIAILGVVVSGCERETRVVEKGGTTVVQPKETVKEKETVVTQPVPGPAGPAGPKGEKGAPGKPTPSTSETKKE